MVIEWLRFRVPPQLREKFIQKDAEIWTALLSSYPGFLGKEIWINPKNDAEITVVIRWESLERWKSVPRDRLDAAERLFSQAMNHQSELIEAGDYQVRKIFTGDR